MCGITGIIEPSPQTPIDRLVLQSMTDALRHRGPDGEGFHYGGGVGLGHRRLSIIDIDGGAQPMSDPSGNLTVTFNGEIYNYVELMRDLKARGCAVETQSDTEVILHAYAEYGDACVNHFNGMFAFALWDQSQRRLLLARDRLGKKPLYYHFADGRLVFASELKALVKHPSVPRDVSIAALDDYLAYGYVPGEECILSGVRKLAPGCLLVWQDGRIRTECYWDVRFAEEEPKDERAWLEELEQMLRDAVRIRLRSDVPLGVFLSGGMDSSGIVALAAQESSTPIKTFSIGFDEAEFNELSYARMVADQYGTDHHELVVRDTDMSVLPEIVYHLDEPFADPSALPTYFVCREARRHVTVCLSGDGGDEVFAGYSRYDQALAHARWDPWTRFGVQQLCSQITRVVPHAMRGRGFLERVATGGAERYAVQVGVFNATERRALFREDLRSAIRPTGALFEPYMRNANGHGLVSRLQHVDQKTYLPDDILVKVDRMSMQNSLEVRSPLLDHRVVERVNQLASARKTQPGVAKPVFQQILAPQLPVDVLQRRKMGFGLPLEHWFRRAPSGYLQDRLLGADSACLEWLDPASVASALRDQQNGTRNLSHQTWTLLILEHWLDAMKP